MTTFRAWQVSTKSAADLNDAVRQYKVDNAAEPEYIVLNKVWEEMAADIETVYVDNVPPNLVYMHPPKVIRKPILQVERRPI